MDSSRLISLRNQQYLFTTSQQNTLQFNYDILKYLSSGTTIVANGSGGIFGATSFRFNSGAGSNGIVYVDGDLLVHGLKVGGDNAVVKNELISTYNGLSTFVNFVATQEIVSSITGLGSSGYLSSINVLTSSVVGLGSAGYLSSISILTSTVTGLGSGGYLSSISILTSTVTGLGMAGYVSSLNSTINGLGTTGYLSSFSAVTSTLIGLGSAGYVSSLNSTINGLGTTGYLSSFSAVTSTVTGLGTAGYISSLNSTINGLGTVGFISSLNSTINGLGNAGYLSSFGVITSTVAGLGLAGYLSSFRTTTSTVAGLGLAGYLSSFGTTTSTVAGLGSAGYLSSFGTITSTVAGLGSAGYLSSFSGLTSSIIGLGSAGYLSTSSGSTISPRLGNVLTVDKVNGNDSIASPGGYPYASINAAVSNLVNGDSIWILPGTYNLTSPIDLSPYNNIAIRGMNLQTVNIVMCNVISDTTLVTLSENSRIEDLNLKLHSTCNVNLVGLKFPGTTSVTSKVRTCLVSIDNSNTSYLSSNDVYCVEFSGLESLDLATFSFNSLKGSTFNVYANGEGRKRGLYLSSGNSVTVRDINVFVAAPRDTRSTGSYVGIETNHPVAEIQCRTTSIGAIPETGSFSASDILQTRGLIQLGPGTDLINKTAGQSTFTSYIAPTTLLYGVKGALNNISVLPAYLWPGSMMVTPQLYDGLTTSYPDNSIGYFRVSQKSILVGISALLNTYGPSDDFTTNITVLKNNIPTYFYINFSNNDTYPLLQTFRGNSINLGIGDYLAVQLNLTGGGSNTSRDLMVQLDLY